MLRLDGTVGAEIQQSIVGETQDMKLAHAQPQDRVERRCSQRFYACPKALCCYLTVRHWPREAMRAARSASADVSAADFFIQARL